MLVCEKTKSINVNYYGTFSLISKMFQKMFTIDEEAIRKTLKKEGTTAEQLDKDKEIIKKWMKSQPHLPEVLGS